VTISKRIVAVLINSLFSIFNKNKMSKELDFKNDLFREIKKLINDARQRVSQTVNAEMSLLYWQVGKRIKTEVLGNEKAGY
jgi:hypothetical protein